MWFVNNIPISLLLVFRNLARHWKIRFLNKLISHVSLRSGPSSHPQRLSLRNHLICVNWQMRSFPWLCFITVVFSFHLIILNHWTAIVLLINVNSAIESSTVKQVLALTWPFSTLAPPFFIESNEIRNPRDQIFCKIEVYLRFFSLLDILVISKI